MNQDRRFILILLCVIAIVLLLNQNIEHFTGHKIFRMYYTNWCGWSRKALPEFKRLGSEVTTAKGEKIKVQLVDCQLNQDLCNKRRIEGYPTLQLESSNGIKEYNGEREYNSMLSFLRNQ